MLFPFAQPLKAYTSPSLPDTLIPVRMYLRLPSSPVIFTPFSPVQCSETEPSPEPNSPVSQFRIVDPSTLSKPGLLTKLNLLGTSPSSSWKQSNHAVPVVLQIEPLTRISTFWVTVKVTLSFLKPPSTDSSVVPVSSSDIWGSPTHRPSTRGITISPAPAPSPVPTSLVFTYPDRVYVPGAMGISCEIWAEEASVFFTSFALPPCR